MPSDRELLEQAYLKIRELRAELDAQHEPIAIIGMACRFPGAPNLEAYWDLLVNGQNAVTEVPPNRWDLDAWYDPDPRTPGKMYARTGGFIEDVDQFEPQFFGISPKEAPHLDPQDRLILESAWHALEHAGVLPASLNKSRTGVFAGTFMSDYQQQNFFAQAPKAINAYNTLPLMRSTAAGRLSHYLGLNGPSVFTDTACSTTLMTAHLAMQSLRNRGCDLALAGGANLMLRPELNVGLCATGALSPDGKCKTFDNDANGYIRGEGCGMLVLKRLSDAEREGDTIHAVIRGSATNHDGPSNGFTAPNGLAQERVIADALADAGVDPLAIQYVEAHGTGTELGDPIEVMALNEALCQGRSKEQPLQVASVKSNIGHLESAAGVASIIKVVLAMKHRMLPPSLHVNKLNEHVPWQRLPISVVTEPQAWQAEERRLAGISGFSMMGANVHLVLEDQPDPEPLAADDAPVVFAASARTKASLRNWLKQVADQLEADAQPPRLVDLCYTAALCRSAFEVRAAFVVESVAELVQAIRHTDGDVRDTGTEHPLHVTARAFLAGEAVDWNSLFADIPCRKVQLPGYAFDRASYWIESVPRPTPSSGYQHLTMPRYGALDQLSWATAKSQDPGPGEVEIEVQAAGLNYRDVARAAGRLREVEENLDLVDPEAIWFGFECAGRVVHAGPDSGFEAGDEVAGLAPGCLAERVVADARLLSRKPETLSMEQAAACPVVYLTAAWALEQLAGLQAGDSVLVHSAGGGVGQAAVRLARAAGARIIATAGEAKWASLKAQGLVHIFDSHTQDYTEQVLAATDGQGVDLVLNTLGESHEAASIACLKPGGCFIELGRLLPPEKVPMGEFSYHCFNLQVLCREQPEALGELLEQLMLRLAKDPDLLSPIEVFDQAKVQDAFRCMRESRHFGKLVIRMSGEEGSTTQPAPVETAGLLVEIETIARAAMGSYAPEVFELDKSLHELGLDSVGQLELLLELEGRFGIKLEESALEQVYSLRGLAELVERMLG